METFIRIGEKRFLVRVERGGSGGWSAAANGKTFLFAAARRLGGATWLIQAGNRRLTVTADSKPERLTVWLDGEKIAATFGESGGEETAEVGAARGPYTLKSAMPGLVKKIKVKTGDRVEKGQGLLVLEAMKMENEILSPVGGKIQSILAKENQAVESVTPLIQIQQ